MGVEVLKSSEQNNAAREEMRRRGIDCTTPLLGRMLRRAGLVPGIAIGDTKKSWDVLRTIQFIEMTVPRHAPILDIGACASEVPIALLRLGYRNLTGIDLDPKIGLMPHSDMIRYEVGTFLNGPFPDGSFHCITAISVIEHGFDSRNLLHEMSRLLKHGGVFIASVDYWPVKIDVGKRKPYGLDWRIFSESELRLFLDESREFGFAPVGETEYSALERAIAWNGLRYTFAWLALQKTG